ncbi:MAG TPA: kelch repeat-containing protein [Acidimicrobiales bacterium]|nr:kelch repeat-containing protein [Acidimicrobiales bacterium]
MDGMSVKRRAALAIVTIIGFVGAGALQSPALAVEGSWAPTGSLKVPRLQATATLLDTGKVLVAGGRNFAFTAVHKSAELYDPLTEVFTLTGSMTDGRWSHTATKLANGKVLVAGGFTDPTSSANAQPVLTSAELYDPATGTWTPTGSMTTRRALHIAQLLPNGKVLVAGGRTCNGPPPLACNSTFTTPTAEIYDPGTGAWTPAAGLNSSRTTTSAVLLASGKVLVPAGFPGGQATADAYDPAANTWTPTGFLNAPRARQGGMLLPDGTALVAAGSTGVAVVSSETYNPATNSWTLAGNVAQNRFNYFFTELPNGKVLIAGGAGGPTASTTAEVFDPATRTWSSAGTIPTPHGSSSSNGNSTRMVLLTGTAAQCGQICGKALLVGDNAAGAAALYTPASSFVCTTTVTGTVANVVVPAGSVTCVNGAFVTGSITVQPGGSLVVNPGTRVVGGITSTGSTGIRICGAQVRNPAGTAGTAISITGTVGPVVIGDGTAGCARNDIVGTVSLDGNNSVELDTNRVAGSVSVANTSGSPQPAVIAANQITGNLTCTNNVPTPTDEGRPNVVLGTTTGCFAAPVI